MAVSPALGRVIPPIRSGPGPGQSLPDLPQVSNASALWSFLVVNTVTIERVKYNWGDPLGLESQLTEEEIAIR